MFNNQRLCITADVSYLIRIGNYDTAMRFVAYTEVFILVWTIGRAVS
jgi:hypothetical protein